MCEGGVGVGGRVGVGGLVGYLHVYPVVKIYLIQPRFPSVKRLHGLSL